MVELNSIFTEIESGNFLSKVVLETASLNKVLDSRDSAPFDTAWVKACQSMEIEWSNSATAELKFAVDKVMHAVFVKVSHITCQHEIASYVSEDFELIAKSLILGISDDFVSGLFDMYRAGDVPC